MTFSINRLVATACVASLGTIIFAGDGFESNVHIRVDLGEYGHEAIHDEARDLIYVSVRNLNQVAIVSAITGEHIESVFVGSAPVGMDLSSDGQRLHVALNQAAAFATVDLNTLAVTETVVGDVVGSSLTWDVAEVAPDRVFVTANPGSGGFAWVAQFDPMSGAGSVVASNRIIRAGPRLHEDPSGEFIYVGEGFSPNSLYKLDLSQEDAPIVLQDGHGDVSGTQRAVVSPDSSRIYLWSGQVLRAESFLQAGSIGNGLKDVSQDGNRVYVLSGNSLIEYNAQTFLQTQSMPLPTIGFLNDFKLLEDDSGFFILNDTYLELFAAPACPIDIVIDNQLNLEDVTTFLSLYNAQDLDADLNGDGSLNFYDVSTLLLAYSQGCN